MGLEPILVSGLVITKNGMLLLSKRASEPFYKFPGGKVEGHESLVECALREFYEETGMYARISEKRGELSIYQVQTNPVKKYELHHFLGILESPWNPMSSYFHEGHEIVGFSVDELRHGFFRSKISPNVTYLLKQGEIK